MAQRKGEKNSTFVFLAGVCVYTQTESHKKTGLEVETFLSSFITTHDEGGRALFGERVGPHTATVA